MSDDTAYRVYYELDQIIPFYVIKREEITYRSLMQNYDERNNIEHEFKSVNNVEGPVEMKMIVENDTRNEPQTNDQRSFFTVGSTCNEVVSKRQLKKQRKKEKWLSYKPLKRAREKERLRQKKLDARLNNIRLGPSKRELKRCKMSQSNCKVRIAIDLSFDDLMNDKEIGKCIKQLLRCYSLNRRAKDPMQFFITNFGGKSKLEMQKHTGYMNWDVNFHSESYTEIFEPCDLVYLTSESDNVISSLEGNKVYIIGGLVDHNAHKGLCHKIAQEKGICHGQLPIEEFLEMKSRKVLTIDHVFEILLEVTGGKSWKEAFIHVLPPRKGATERIEEVKDDSTGHCIREESSTSPEEAE